MSQKKQHEPLIRKVDLYLGLGSAALGVALAVKSGEVLLAIIICFLVLALIFTPRIIYYVTHRKFKFEEISERVFLDKLEMEDVRRISVLCHTGRITYDEIFTRLEALIKGRRKCPEEIRVLIRDPLVEGLYRSSLIRNSVAKASDLRRKGVNIDVRFYESVPSVRGTVCELHTKQRVSYVSSYYWPDGTSSKASDVAYVIRDSEDSKHPLANVLESWFDRYWGKGDLHTVVFDFDDTLVSTLEIQLAAWWQVIRGYLASKQLKENDLSTPLKESLGNDKSYKNVIRESFVKKQLADEIIKDLIPNVDEGTAKDINRARSEIRAELMRKSNAKLFDGVEKKLEKLHVHYNFAIITATDEEVVGDYLREHKLDHYFPVILGKHDPLLKSEQEYPYSKTALLMKFSKMLGVPLNRVVYIGDRSTDYLAAQQLGIPFVEARLIPSQGVKSSADTGKSILGHFTTYTNDELDTLLEDYSKRITIEKYRLAK